MAFLCGVIAEAVRVYRRSSSRGVSQEQWLDTRRKKWTKDEGRRGYNDKGTMTVRVCPILRGSLLPRRLH